MHSFTRFVQAHHVLCTISTVVSFLTMLNHNVCMFGSGTNLFKVLCTVSLLDFELNATRSMHKSFYAHRVLCTVKHDYILITTRLITQLQSFVDNSNRLIRNICCNSFIALLVLCTVLSIGSWFHTFYAQFTISWFLKVSKHDWWIIYFQIWLPILNYLCTY